MHLSKISLALRQWGAAGFSPLSLFAAGEVGAWYDPSDLSTMFQDSAGTTSVTAAGQPVGLILDKSKGLALGPELITNGDFSAGSTGWTLAASYSVVSGALVATSAAAFSDNAFSSEQAVGNTVYRITFTCTSLSAGQFKIICGNSQAGPIISAPGTYSCTCGASSSGSAFFIQAQSPLTATFDNISVRKVSGNHAFQATAAARPLYKVTGLCKWNDFDAVDDVLNTTFPSSLGSSCTVARGNVGAAPTILTGQTIGTSYANSTDNCGLIIVNRALTGQEIADLTAWLTAKGATS